MDISVLLGIAIGLMAMYFLVATACSYIVEAGNSFLNVRGKALELFVREMIVGAHSGPAESKPGWLRRALLTMGWLQQGSPVPWRRDLSLLDHPLLSALKKPTSAIAGTPTVPSYVPSELFAKALLDRIANHIAPFLVPTESLVEIFNKVAIDLQNPASGAARLVMDDLSLHQGESYDTYSAIRTYLFSTNPSPDEALARITALTAAIATGSPPIVARLLEVIREHAERQDKAPLDKEFWNRVLRAVSSNQNVVDLSPVKLRELLESGGLPSVLSASLRPIVQSANYDIDRVQEGIERWYDSVMDRASGWFKRRATVLLAAVALVFAVSLNLDTFAIANHLNKDPIALEASFNLAGTIARGDIAASEQIPQQAAFAWAFKNRNWGEMLANPSDERLQRIASEATALLHRRGGLVAPMNVLHSIARQLTLCQPEDKECAASRETTRKGLLSQIHAICKVIAHGSTPIQQCSSQSLDAIKDLDQTTQALCQLLRSDAVSWSPPAAIASWNLIVTHENAGSPASCRPRPATPSTSAPSASGPLPTGVPAMAEKDMLAMRSEFREAILEAQDMAAKLSGDVSSLVSRIPSIGPIWLVGGSLGLWQQRCGTEARSLKKSALPANVSVFASLECLGSVGVAGWLPLLLVLVVGCVALDLRNPTLARPLRWAQRACLASGIAILLLVIFSSRFSVGDTGENLLLFLEWAFLLCCVGGIAISIWIAFQPTATPGDGMAIIYFIAAVGTAWLLFFNGLEFNLSRFLPVMAGWAITALMASFGAPFWFDLLNKLVSQRVTGPKPSSTTVTDS